MKIELMEHQVNNLKLFLDRVPIKGIQENAAFMEIMIQIENGVKDEDSAL